MHPLSEFSDPFQLACRCNNSNDAYASWTCGPRQQLDVLKELGHAIVKAHTMERELAVRWKRTRRDGVLNARSSQQKKRQV